MTEDLYQNIQMSLQRYEISIKSQINMLRGAGLTAATQRDVIMNVELWCRVLEWSAKCECVRVVVHCQEDLPVQR